MNLFSLVSGKSKMDFMVSLNSTDSGPIIMTKIVIVELFSKLK